MNDNPYSGEQMGITLSETDVLPFESKGSNPTDKDLDDYPHIILMSDDTWDPQQLIMLGNKQSAQTVQALTNVM